MITTLLLAGVFAQGGPTPEYRCWIVTAQYACDYGNVSQYGSSFECPPESGLHCPYWVQDDEPGYFPQNMPYGWKWANVAASDDSSFCIVKRAVDCDEEGCCVYEEIVYGLSYPHYITTGASNCP